MISRPLTPPCIPFGTVGCVANRSEVYENGEKVQTLEAALCGKGCEKATDFINFCDAFSIPVLTLVNVNGYRATMCSERKIAKLAAKLTYAYADATVPKKQLIVIVSRNLA